jgi:hypothetical protein
MNLFATVTMIAAYVCAGAGVLAAFMSFGLEGATGIGKFINFLSSLALGAGLGATALAASLLLRSREQDVLAKEQGRA